MALKGVRVLEMAGLAPGPFCGMVLRDFGATVVRIDKPHPYMDADRLSRGKMSIVINMKDKKGITLLKRMADKSDVLIEPYRPGVMERLGLGPETLQKSNPGLIYARISGFGQNGPFAHMAGHDINYVALSGVLSMLGEHNRNPQPPVNILADFAGGGLLCALGICMALLERHKSGLGQVIDASMVEGAAYVSSFLWRSRSSKMSIPIWVNERGKDLLDGGAHFYNTYETKDGQYMAVGALEPQFYEKLLQGLGLEGDTATQFGDWDDCRQLFATIFKSKTQEEWCSIFDGSDSCVVPVLPYHKAHEHRHNAERRSFAPSGDGCIVPRPSPRLSRTPAEPDYEEPRAGQHTNTILESYGFSKAEIDDLLEKNVVEAEARRKSKL
ncbi:alpha-methylacyl-CoA racemase-like [Ornithodoros turicata]|uniref:alpha-methylacyl-CoA racemase-like n=1 Tax=Ornithodoros turicata TaxID=34597 RepID=UPI00313A250B